MKDIYKEYLFTKHILVYDDSKTEEKDQFAILFSLANLFNIRITSGEKLLQQDMISFVSSQLGENVPEPFYRGFPDSVRQLSKDQLLYDQLIHYCNTYGLGNFSEAGHSLFEERFDRIAFKENSEIREFIVITEGEAVEKLKGMVDQLLSGTRPMNEMTYQMVRSFIEEYEYDIRFAASKDTCVKLLMDTKDLRLAGFLSLSDVIKLTDVINFYKYQNTNIRKLNLKNCDRKLITAVIKELFKAGRCDLRTCYEKKKIWCGLLHHIHYQAASDEEKAFLNAMRGKGNESVFSEFERAMNEKNVRAAADALRNGKGSAAVLRNLNYLISRAGSAEEMEYVLSCIDTKNVIVLMQLLLAYSKDPLNDEMRTFTFTKYDMLKAHTETETEVYKRKSRLSADQTGMLAERIREKLSEILKNRLGRVYIDPEMKNYALPLQENTTQSGFGVLTKGSRIHIGDAKKIRAFTYWEKVDDIDLSVFGINKKGERTEFSWRTMADKQSDAIVYSGDETSGYNGGSEYFDIDTEEFRRWYPDIRYMIFCDNVFSAIHFSECFCKAGYMLRDKEDSGEIYEPKTVRSSFVVNGNSTYTFLFGIDMKTNDFVWLNTTRNGSATVAGETDMNFLIDHFHTTEVLNVYSFFEMMASELTDDPLAADIVVTDKNISVNEGTEVIREYDIEKMLELMNR